MVVRLARIAFGMLEESLQQASICEERIRQLQLEVKASLADAPTATRSELDHRAAQLVPALGQLSDNEIRQTAKLIGANARGRRTAFLRSSNAEVQDLRLRNEQALSVKLRYEHWLELERRFEDFVAAREDREEQQRERFARQCAYVLFLKVLLVRIFEDKKIVKTRLITDGGIDLWISTLKPRLFAQQDEAFFGGDSLLSFALQKAASYYSELLRHDVYDWFMPDDLSILDIVEALSGYNFAELATDIVGYIYQRFLQETEQHRVGHYLTPPEVVDYILDAMEYVSTSTDILGRDLLDPACGSGSFLVHAAVRYRKALVPTESEWTVEMATSYLDDLQRHFVGVDINPFSCHLARLNLLMLALDALAVLEKAGQPISVSEFRIYNSDTLDFSAVTSHKDWTATEPADPVTLLKVRQGGRFFYVCGNPPYINVKNETIELSDITSSEFFESWLHGDVNTYLLFLRAGLHFLAPGGLLGFIVPSTVLGDAQAESFRREATARGYRLRHVTRFYTERVLFKPVEQATSVVVIQNIDDDGDVVIRGGGRGSTALEATQDVESRPKVKISGTRLRLWVCDSELPKTGLGKSPKSALSKWSLLWPVVPEKAAYYELWDYMVSASSETVKTLLASAGLDLVALCRQGDVNTTYAKPFHVEAKASGAMPLYKGEEIDQLVPLVYLPERGPKGRSPFLKSDPAKATIGTAKSACAALNRIATLKATEQGFVLHEVAKFRVRRRISGTWFERGPGGAKVVFPHTLWVVAPLSEEVGPALLGLLTSLPVNFAYHFCSTNNHVNTSLLGALPVPGEFSAYGPSLSSLVRRALKASDELLAAMKLYGVSRTQAFRRLNFSPDPLRVLSVSKTLAVKVNDWRARGWLSNKASDATLARLSVQILVSRGKIEINGPAEARNIWNVWVQCFGDRRWPDFLDLPIADVPARFWMEWTNALKTLSGAQTTRESSQSEIDAFVAKLYKLPAEFYKLVEDGPPWLAGAANDAQEDEVESESSGDA